MVFRTSKELRERDFDKFAKSTKKEDEEGKPAYNKQDIDRIMKKTYGEKSAEPRKSAPKRRFNFGGARERLRSGFESFDSGVETLGSYLDAGDSFGSSFLGFGSPEPARATVGKKKRVPIYRGRKVVGYREVRTRPRNSRQGADYFGAMDSFGIDPGDMFSFSQPRSKRKSNSYEVNWL